VNARSPLGAVTLSIALGVVALPASASAADGTYAVHSCKGPSNQPAPTTGWAPTQSAGTAAVDGCAGGGGLSLSLGPNPAGSYGASWTFTAPADTSIVSLAADRRTSGFASAPADSQFRYGLFAGTTPLDSCTKAGDGCPNDYVQPISKPGLNASTIRFRLYCANGDQSCTNPQGVGATLGKAVIGLKDAIKPQIVGQKVVDSGETSGTFRVRFSATDQGGGLYRVRTLVDGQPFAIQPVTGGTCTDALPGNADDYEFLAPQPCPLGLADRDVAVSASSLPPGPHTVLTEVEDAAGNTQTVSVTQFPRVNVNDGGSGDGGGSGGGGGSTVAGSNGSNDGASDYERLRHARVKSWFDTSKRRNGRKDTGQTRLTIKRGRRALIRGTIRDRKGRGIVGATLDLYHLTGDGKRRLLKTGVKSRKRGMFTYIVSANVDTRRIQMAYRALRPGKITSRKTLRLTVKRKGKTYYMPGNRPKAKGKKRATAAR